MLGIYDIKVCDFEFFAVETPEGAGAYDPRIEPTLTGLLGDYFDDARNVLIYLCDAADGRPEARQALFTRWHRGVADKVDHRPMIIQADEFAVYGGMMTRKDMPYPDVVQSELIHRAGELILEKFGR